VTIFLSIFVPIWVLIIPDLSTRALWQISVDTPSSESGMFCEKYLCHTLHISLTCRKILRHGADDFASPPKEGALRIFIALKIHRPLVRWNSRTLGPVASTITTRPPRAILQMVTLVTYWTFRKFLTCELAQDRSSVISFHELIAPILRCWLPVVGRRFANRIVWLVWLNVACINCSRPQECGVARVLIFSCVKM
jgi:hypothetical protein